MSLVPEEGGNFLVVLEIPLEKVAGCLLMHGLVLDLKDSQHRTQMKALNQPRPHPSSKIL